MWTNIVYNKKVMPYILRNNFFFVMTAVGKKHVAPGYAISKYGPAFSIYFNVFNEFKYLHGYTYKHLCVICTEYICIGT